MSHNTKQRWFKERDWPEGAAQGGNTILWTALPPARMRLKKIIVLMAVANTQGTYTLVVTNTDTGNTMLSGASFDMNSLGDAVAEEVPLTATVADLIVSAAPTGRFTISLASDNAAFDGSGIYIAYELEEP